MGIASVPDPKGTCDFKKRKGGGGKNGVIEVTQAYVESSHGGGDLYLMCSIPSVPLTRASAVLNIGIQ
ncbi:hypothetical protein STEG23_022037, partial [Scotinomys teguina]